MMPIQLDVEQIDCTPYLLLEGLDDVTFRIEDESGVACIGSMRFKLVNRDNLFNRLKAQRRDAAVVLKLNHTFIFGGVVSEAGYNYNPAREVIEFEVIGKERILISRTQRFGPTFDYGLYQWGALQLPIYRTDGTTVGRAFYSVEAILEGIAYYGGASYNRSQRFSKYFIGGKTWQKAQLPEGDYYKMLKDLSKTFNLVWYIEQEPPKDIFKAIPKFELLGNYVRNNTIFPRLVLPLCYEGTTISGQRAGVDWIKISYPNQTTHRLQLKGFGRGDSIVAKTKEVSLPFRQPEVYASDHSYIKIDDDEYCDYIVRLLHLGGTLSPQLVEHIPLEDYQTRYERELYGTIQYEGEFSLLEAYKEGIDTLVNVIKKLRQPYYPIQVPGYEGLKTFIREASINLRELKVKIKAVGYEVN